MDSSLIPIPFRQRWRQFRMRVFPPAAFLLALTLVVQLWKTEIAGPALPGEVQSVRANVISTVPGTLAELAVEPFQRVHEGQVIGRLFPADPETLKASLLVIELDLRLLRARMAVDRERNDLDYQQLRLDYLQRRMELATARADLQFAESEFARTVKQHHEKIVSTYEYDVAFRDQERLRAEVAEQSQIVAELEQALERLQPAQVANREAGGNSAHFAKCADPFAAALAAQETKLLLLEGPVTLRAPMDGMIGTVNFRPGEKVMAGEPIVTISAVKSERVIGYARQPLRMQPRVGDQVQVRTRGVNRQTATAQILQVGSEIQRVGASQRLRPDDSLQERGLPFLVALPPELQVYPGELVDLILIR
jgi:multidrug resistance efflux pump